LTGTVPSEREKQRIETLAQSLSGVSRVDNQLQVSLAPTSEGVGQTSRIYSNSTSQAAGTIPGQVNTEGLTPTSDRQDSNRVYSNDSFKVTVQGANETDQTLSQQIRSTLQKDPAIASLGSNVKISLENGKATLMGTVTDEDSKNKIESAIQQVSGVTSVDNQLQVNAGGTPPEQSK
jgi:osmotically-inducible protein OsmY